MKRNLLLLLLLTLYPLNRLQAQVQTLPPLGEKDKVREIMNRVVKLQFVEDNRNEH